MADDVPEEVKKRRNNELLAVQNEISYESSRSFVGKTVEILVEGPSKRETKSMTPEEALYAESVPLEATVDTVGNIAPIPEGSSKITTVDELLATATSGAKKPGDLVQMTGRTVCDRIVVFDGARSLAGTFQQIRITDATPFTLCGELVK